MTRTLELRAVDGSSVAIQRSPEGDVLETRDARGRILFQYDPVSGRAAVTIPGGLDLSAGGPIRIASRDGVEIRSHRAIALESGRSRLSLSGRRTRLVTGSLETRAEEASHAGERVSATAREARFSWGRLEQAAERVLTRARHLYQRVEELMHVRAGRARNETEGTHLVRAGRVHLHGRDDVRVRGERINLG